MNELMELKVFFTMMI